MDTNRWRVEWASSEVDLQGQPYGAAECADKPDYRTFRNSTARNPSRTPRTSTCPRTDRPPTSVEKRTTTPRSKLSERGATGKPRGMGREARTQRQRERNYRCVKGDAAFLLVYPVGRLGDPNPRKVRPQQLHWRG